MRKDSWFRGALLSVLFFVLLNGNAPLGAQDDQGDSPLDWGLGDLMEVVGEYVPVPPIYIPPPPDPESEIAASIMAPQYDFVQRQLYEALKNSLTWMADRAGHTTGRVCRWYDENYKSKGASAVRIGIAVAALIYMYWDLRDREGNLSLTEIELKKQLTGVLAIIAAGGHGDTIVRDACNMLGHPI